MVAPTRQEHGFRFNQIWQDYAAQEASVERVFGYQYWLSWDEPAWVLRDFVGKFERRAPAHLRPLIRPISAFYDRGWNWLDERFGHFFLQNVVAVFRVARKGE